MIVVAAPDTNFAAVRGFKHVIAAALKRAFERFAVLMANDDAIATARWPAGLAEGRVDRDVFAGAHGFSCTRLRYTASTKLFVVHGPESEPYRRVYPLAGEAALI